MTNSNPLSVGELAQRLAPITGNSEAFHARQLRAQIREGALKPSLRGGSGPTAPALFDDIGLCRALVLHALASVKQEMDTLKAVATIMETVDPRARKADVVEPDGMALAVARIRNGEAMFLHLEFSMWPVEGEEDREVSGWITNDPTPNDSAIMPRRAWIVLPLHHVLKPLVG